MGIVFTRFGSLGLDLLMPPPEMTFGLPSSRESPVFRIGKHPAKAHCLLPCESGSYSCRYLEGCNSREGARSNDPDERQPCRPAQALCRTGFAIEVSRPGSRMSAPT